MSKKLLGNGLFESSRMMLPEHKEAISAHQRTFERRERPALDEQAIEDYSKLIHESLMTGRLLTLHVYTEYPPDVVVTGSVLRVQGGRILFFHGQKTWIDARDIVSIQKDPPL